MRYTILKRSEKHRQETKTNLKFREKILKPFTQNYTDRRGKQKSNLILYTEHPTAWHTAFGKKYSHTKKRASAIEGRLLWGKSQTQKVQSQQ